MKPSRKVFVLILAFSLITATAALTDDPAKDASLPSALSLAAEFTPSPFIYLDNSPSSHILLVEKRSQKLYILTKPNGVLEIQKSYTVSTGKNSGDKSRPGDMKTPEGVYFINEKKDDSILPAKYGAGAFVTDYPNVFDIMSKKMGKGIWIHGTDDPERLNSSNDTQGCVILKNEDLLDLSRYIEFNRTPVVIVNEVEYRRLEFVDKDRQEILEFLDGWKTSWESKDIDTYINFYSPNFIFKTMSRSAYRFYKKNLADRYPLIQVKLSNIQVFRSDENILINFLQEYSTDIFSDFGVKQLFLVKEGNRSKIIRERWAEIARSP